MVNDLTVISRLQLTGTVFSACILYLRSAAGFPVRSRKMKKELLAKNTIGGTREEPAEMMYMYTCSPRSQLNTGLYSSPMTCMLKSLSPKAW